MELSTVVANGDKQTLEELQKYLDGALFRNGRIVTSDNLRLAMYMNPSTVKEHKHGRSGLCKDCDEIYLGEAIDNVAFGL